MVPTDETFAIVLIDSVHIDWPIKHTWFLLILYRLTYKTFAIVLIDSVYILTYKTFAMIPIDSVYIYRLTYESFVLVPIDCVHVDWPMKHLLWFLLILYT